MSVNFCDFFGKFVAAYILHTKLSSTQHHTYTLGHSKYCRLCNCDPIGSKSDAGCDADSGQCLCHPGVTGLTCDKCLPLHYGFLEAPQGCHSCDCHPKGAVKSSCHGKSGLCQCLSKVVGRKCDKCQFGFWNIDSGAGCEKCHCDPMGSYDNDCNDINGQCRCKTGVGEKSCSACIAGYWGFSSRYDFIKKPLITIFGHKHKIKNFDIFHENFLNAFEFWFIFGKKF